MIFITIEIFYYFKSFQEIWRVGRTQTVAFCAWHYTIFLIICFKSDTFVHTSLKRLKISIFKCMKLSWGIYTYIVEMKNKHFLVLDVRKICTLFSSCLILTPKIQSHYINTSIRVPRYYLIWNSRTFDKPGKKKFFILKNKHQNILKLHPCHSFLYTTRKCFHNS